MGKKDLKVLLLGSSGAGKTALAVMFERKYFPKTYEQTVVAETHSKEILVDGQVIHMEILDCGAPTQLPEYTQHIKNADGLVAVYDITSLPSFSKIEAIVRYAQQNRNCPCILVGTKQDLEKERAIRPQDGTALANDLGCPYLEITATSEYAVTEMFKLIAKLILTFDDSDQTKKKKGGFKRLLKFKKKSEGPSAEFEEEEDDEQGQISDSAHPLPPLPSLPSHSLPPLPSAPINTSASVSQPQPHSTPSNPLPSSTSHSTSISNSNNTITNGTNSPAVSPDFPSELLSSTKIISPSLPPGTSGSAFELIHFMTELKALLIQQKDFTGLQEQMLSEREKRLELEKQVIKLEQELLLYKQEYGDLK